jgi:hypothetical protein
MVVHAYNSSYSGGLETRLSKFEVRWAKACIHCKNLCKMPPCTPTQHNSKGKKKSMELYLENKLNKRVKSVIQVLECLLSVRL